MPLMRRQPGDAEDLEPASRSMHMSSLYRKDNFQLPQMRSLDVVQSSLEHDGQSQCSKYETGEPNSRSARFCVNLPRSPQHLKYSWKIASTSSTSMKPASTAEAAEASSCSPQSAAPEAVPSPRGRPPSLKSVRFNKHTLHLLFREMDRKQTGFVTHRGLMAAMIRWLLQQGSDVTAAREASSWIRECAKEVETEEGNRGNMDWKAFLHVFRRAGLLLERDEETYHLDSLEALMQVKHEHVKSVNVVKGPLGEEHSNMEKEIRTCVGKPDSARYSQKDRRAATPECK